jgi:Raf kinase inhibitor-like YbhB/YbcL family protein
MSLIVLSKAFGPGERIPARFTADGEDLSPPLSWQGAPAGTREFALICDDPDAPSPHPWVHWLMYCIPAPLLSLPEGVSSEESPPEVPDAQQGKNSWGNLGYGGPAPPRGHGVHRYHFGVYALGSKLDLPAGLDKASLLGAMKGHILMSGELIGTYERDT